MGKMFEDVRFEPTEESNMLFLAAGWPTGASEEERLFGVPTDCKVKRLFTNIVVFARFVGSRLYKSQQQEMKSDYLLSIKFVILPDNCHYPLL